MLRKDLYIDSAGLIRGYYVYLHIDRAADEVFYVGKGNGQRAWEVDRRNNLWKEKVASLSNEWDVEIVEQDLSETEAFELEAKLVEKYGGCVAEGGTLTNWIPGGEHPVSVSFSLTIPDDGGWAIAYEEARKFKEFPRAQQVSLITNFDKDLEGIIVSLQHLEKEAEDKGNVLLSDIIMEIDSLINNLRDNVKEFLRRRLSWNDLALEIDESYDEIDLLVDNDTEEQYKKVKILIDRTYDIISMFMNQIESGNREEAEKIATLMTIVPAAEKGDASAQACLGNRYTLGRGVPQDDVQAYKWYSIAEIQGQSDFISGKLFDILKKRMTPTQIAEAERLSREWLAENHH